MILEQYISMQELVTYSWPMHKGIKQVLKSQYQANCFSINIVNISYIDHFSNIGPDIGDIIGLISYQVLRNPIFLVLLYILESADIWNHDIEREWAYQVSRCILWSVIEETSSEPWSPSTAQLLNHVIASKSSFVIPILDINVVSTT